MIAQKTYPILSDISLIPPAMKSWQVVALVLTALTTLLLTQKSTPSSQAFEIWKAEFGHQFTAEEEAYRQIIFAANVEAIELHNADKTQTYTKGINQFTHLSKEEFSGMFLNRFHQMQDTKVEAVSTSMTPVLKEIDWQALGKVSAVGNQGNCDAGYAFCSTSLIESFYLFKNVVVNLSKQQIVDCSANYTTFGCQSGSRNGTLIYIREIGLTTEADYPYKAAKNVCQKQGGAYTPDYKHVEFNGCDNIKNGLYTTPLTVAVNALDWQTYRSGIFDGCTSTTVNHDIILIGVNSDSWRLKNSWGVRWGEYGYIRLKTGNTCGICEKPAFGFS